MMADSNSSPSEISFAAAFELAFEAALAEWETPWDRDAVVMD
jgi:hypothetical protein